jgi:hypothetical protein
MTAAISSLDLGEEATVTAREGQAGSNESGMASVAPAVSGRITLAQDREEGSQGLALSYDDMAPTRVRALIILVRDMLICSIEVSL